MRLTDYEALGVMSVSLSRSRPSLLEYYSGTSIVQWYGNIEGQLSRMEEQYRAAKNEVYADRIHEFLMTWRDNEITGSINIETVEVLAASAAQLAVDDWQLYDYFRNLRDQLRKLIASQEELPMTSATPQRRRLTPKDGPSSLGPDVEQTPGEGGGPGGAEETAGTA